MKVAFQGVRGAYSEQATRQFFPKQTPTFLPCEEFGGVFDAVLKGKAQAGVIPIENTLTGSIHQNFDLLRERKVWIAGETRVRVSHNLIVQPGVKKKDITRVLSHPQGLYQCQKFLNRHRSWKQEPAFDTAGSVELLKNENIRDGAAVAGKTAAEYYSMDILAEAIEDNKQNFTRFFLLRKTKRIERDANKTTLMFGLKDAPGVLFKALSVFAVRDLSLAKIESRPIHGKPWEYYFYADVIGCLRETAFQNAIRHLEELTTSVRVLGSYRAAEDK